MEYLKIKKEIASTEKRLNDILQEKKDLNEKRGSSLLSLYKKGTV